MLLLHPDILNKNTYKYTIWLTVLRLMEAIIFIKYTISNSIQLQKEHVPDYFCYLLSSKKIRNIYSLYQVPSLIPLFFLFCLTSLVSKKKSCLIIKQQMPSTQPMCHTSVSVLALTPTSILWGYLLIKHMAALKYAQEVSEATERTHTSLIFFYPACKLVLKLKFLVTAKRRFGDLILNSKEFTDLLAFGISTRTEAGAWSQWWKRDVQHPAHTTSLRGWTSLL